MIKSSSFDGENKPKIYKLLDKKIAEYWQAVKMKDEEIAGWDDEKFENYEQGREITGEDFINVWTYYSECKKLCGISGAWLPQKLYTEYIDYICEQLKIS